MLIKLSFFYNMIFSNQFKSIGLVALILLVLGCNSKVSELKEGDLLFQDLNCGPLCDAIEAVT